ncbi:helix-turn-helix domain-containing protein [Naumannella halotolerans]|uniref:AraC-like DNA-binding protein n=1 Tax=Naumannella halotolerans TaxID=993414 RepID=A0A4R7JAU2_9ACTN|nr:helix-turn-helix domain-containing protein [Naumannella halotolerans]TDT33757.1 AraC-like DNA-binding protein [Naumannella halotolerans]
MDVLSTTVWRTGMDIHQWRTLVNTSFVPVQVDPLHGIPFAGDLHMTTVNEVTVFELAQTPHVVHRTPELIAASEVAGGGFYKLSLQREGIVDLIQDGRTAHIRPGDVAIYDTTRPYELRVETDSRSLILLFPRRMVDLTPSDVAEVTARVFTRESVLGRLVIPFLEGLGANVERLQGPSGARMVNTALDLLVTLLSSEIDLDSDPRRRLAKDVQHYIEQRLGDATMTPASIAKAHFISTRHLHAIFSEEGATLSAWIRDRRLQQIRRELADPLHAGDPLQQIAARWGLPGATHFSKLFRHTYGESPSHFRRRMLGAIAAQRDTGRPDPQRRVS